MQSTKPQANERAGTANKKAEEAGKKEEELRAQNLATEAKLEEERTTRLKMESAIAPRVLEQLQSAKELKPFAGISVRIESLAESEPWRTAGQIAFILDQAGWTVLPGMQRYLDGTGFFDGVAVESNVGRTTDNSGEAAEALVTMLKSNNIDAHTRPALPQLPPRTIRVRIGLKPAAYFNRDRRDPVYGNMLYK